MADAQDSGGSNLSLSVSQTLRYSDNTDLEVDASSAFSAQTNLGLSYSSQTRSEAFSFSANTGLVFSPNDDVDTGIIDPSLRFSYGRTSRTAEFNISGFYRSVELNSFIDDEDPETGLTVLDAGTRTDISGSILMAFGRDRPFGGSFTLSGSNRDYTDTIDPNLLDMTTLSANSVFNLRFDDRITGRLTAGWTEVDEDGGTDQTTLRFGTGVSLLVNPTLTVGVDLNYFDIESRENGAVDREDGFGVTATASQTLPNGGLSGRVSSSIEQNGRRNSFSVSRNWELQNGQFGLTVGGSDSSDTDFSPLYGLNYNTELVRGGNLSASLNQAYDIESDGDEAINTNLTVSYSQALSRVSNVSTSLAYRDTNSLSGDIEDATRWDFNVRYRHSLSRDWGLVSGYTYSFATSDGLEDRDSNTIFFGVDRAFEWRP